MNNNQFEIWDYLSNEAPEEAVDIKGALNTREMPVSEYKVRLSYGDLVLIISMLEDYVKGLDKIKKEDIQWKAYYRQKFKKISEQIQTGIDYDYEKKLKECMKKTKKNSDVGQDALILALKN